MSWMRVCTAGGDLVNGLSFARVPEYVDEDVMVGVLSAVDVDALPAVIVQGEMGGEAVGASVGTGEDVQGEFRLAFPGSMSVPGPRSGGEGGGGGALRGRAPEHAQEDVLGRRGCEGEGEFVDPDVACADNAFGLEEVDKVPSESLGV